MLSFILINASGSISKYLSNVSKNFHSTRIKETLQHGCGIEIFVIVGTCKDEL